MIKIIYTVKQADLESEINWLREQKIYPAVQPGIDSELNIVYRLGMIASPAAVTFIKLRQQKLSYEHKYSKK
jgi:hypothetical protein